MQSVNSSLPLQGELSFSKENDHLGGNVDTPVSKEKMRYKAFTLLELIFSIVIISIVSSIAIPKFMDIRNDAMASTIKSDINTIITSIQTSYLINGKVDKISDIITLNNSIWNVQDKKVIFKSKENNCIIIEILEEDDNIQVTINEDASSTCEKLKELGISSRIYTLN